MTPTWKVGDVYYRFIDAVDYMVVMPFTVTKVHKLYTEAQSRTSRVRVKHQIFDAEYADSEHGAVALAVEDVERQARFHSGVAASKKMLAGNYKQFLLEME